MATLLLRDVSHSFEEKIPLLREISYTFSGSNFYAIMGRSGAGKSTLLHILAGLEVPQAGAVCFDEVVMTAALFQSYRQSMIGILFQNPFLVKECTALDNVLLRAKKYSVDVRSQAQELLSKVGLSGKESRYPHQLSGGEQHRVALARSLMGEPKFLLADEPTGNLDEETSAVIKDFFKELIQSSRIGIIVATHDQSLAKNAGVLLRLQEGKLSQIAQ